MLDQSRLPAAMILFFVQSCACEDSSLPVTTDELIAPAVPEPDVPPDPPATFELKTTPKLSAGSKKSDPYAGWETWCEPLDWSIACEVDADCDGVLDPSSRPTLCATPWWARNKDSKVCLPGWPGSKARTKQIENLRLIASAACTPPRWWRSGKGMNVGTCWKKNGSLCSNLCDPDRLHALLTLVATRESTLRPWKRHRLNADVKANKQSWSIYAKHYGWEVTVNSDDVRTKQATTSPNYHYLQKQRWQGLGAFGQNAPLNVMWWDTKAPPEVLCRLEIATEVYLRRLRAAWTKLNAGVKCGEVIFHGSSPDDRPAWLDLHRAASTGQLCPHPRDADFIRRASSIRLENGHRYALDAYEEVPLEWLGSQQGDPNTQLAIADQIHSRFSE